MLHTRFKAEPPKSVIGFWRNSISTYQRLSFFRISSQIRNLDKSVPGYTFERAAGELWRSRFDGERNLIVVNSGHRDFVFATRNRALQLRYLVRLYVNPTCAVQR